MKRCFICLLDSLHIIEPITVLQPATINFKANELPERSHRKETHTGRASCVSTERSLCVWGMMSYCKYYNKP